MAIKTHTDIRWLVPLFVLLCYFMVQAARLPVGDFGNYYYASRFLLKGNWGTWVYDPAAFNLAVYEEGQRNFFLNYAPVPPLSVLIYLPFALLDTVTVKIAWNALNSLLFLLSLYRLQQHFNFKHGLLWLMPLLFFTPIRNTVYEGQSYFLLLFLLSEGLVRYTKQQTWTAAVLWAFCIHLKISPAFIILFLVFEKDWKTTLKLAGISLALVFISLPLLGTSIWTNYIFNILPRLFRGEINNTYAINYQSMQVLLKTLFVPDRMHNPAALFNKPLLYQKLTWIFNFLIYGLTICCSFIKTRTEAKFSIWLMCSLLVSGYGNSFSLVLLVLPLFGLCQYLLEDYRRVTIAATLLIVVTNIPLTYINHLPVILQFPRLYILLVIFITCIWWIKPVVKPLNLLFVLPAFVVPVNHQKYEQNYFLPREEYLLVYDFRIRPDSLVLFAFDQSGPRQKRLALPFAIRSVKKQRIGKDKMPECLINDSILLYLSDRNRGVGFYTLRYDLPDSSKRGINQ